MSVASTVSRVPALVAAVLLTVHGAAAWAQTDHAGHGAPAAAAQKAAPSSQEFQAANDRMHRDMGVALTGDADRDFLAGMIPHHQGAIDMAEVVLRHGKDARVRQLAEEIIRAQKAEIAQMQAWLREMPAAPTR
ncbi:MULTISPECIES: CopM family metallochaperone [Hydrogenophaga]|uniref:DUF305 domain-containing protein n=1 Tax=Hydrogenophaga electricum TaxID=1230953 RepID=A0ABQ6C7L8_9BURK|nr:MULTISPECIES: DUF305 domain-containing protein [Hydrogenophaga]GLS14755.1 hypothetical protein GCM10007935_21870 [Hydrogenophaga electricum]